MATNQQEIATLGDGTKVYQDEYVDSGWGGLKRYAYSRPYKGENTVNPDDSPLTPAERVELAQIQRQRIAANARKHTPRR